MDQKRSIVIGILGALAAASAFAVIAGGDIPFGEQSKAKAAVLAVMMNPAATQFRNVRTTDDGFFVCGEANGKNQLGAYMGFKAFSYSVNVQDVSFNESVVRAFCK